MIAATDIIRLKVTLDDAEPTVMRRIEVPLGIRLDRLHAVLQAALGWTNSHLWELKARDIGWGIPGWGGPARCQQGNAAGRAGGYRRQEAHLPLRLR